MPPREKPVRRPQAASVHRASSGAPSAAKAGGKARTAAGKSGKARSPSTDDEKTQESRAAASASSEESDDSGSTSNAPSSLGKSSGSSEDLLIPGLPKPNSSARAREHDSDVPESSSSMSDVEGFLDEDAESSGDDGGQDESEEGNSDTDSSGSSADSASDVDADVQRGYRHASKRQNVGLSVEGTIRVSAVVDKTTAEEMEASDDSYEGPEDVLAKQIFVYSSDSAPDSDPESSMTRDERTWASLSPWEMEHYGARKPARDELMLLFDATTKSLRELQVTLRGIQDDMDRAWATNAKRTGVAGPPRFEVAGTEPNPQWDPCDPQFRPETIPEPDPKLFPPRHDENQRAIRRCLLRIRDTLKPLVKSWHPTDRRLEAYARLNWDQDVPEAAAERAERRRKEGKGDEPEEAPVELFGYPPYTLRPEYADLVFPATDPLWRNRYAGVGSTTSSGGRKEGGVGTSNDQAPVSGTASDPLYPYTVTKLGDATVVSLDNYVHPAHRPAPETPAHLRPYTSETAPSLPFLNMLLHSFFEPCISIHSDPTPFFLGSLEETADQPRLSFAVLDRAVFVREGMDHSDTKVIDAMLDAVTRGIELYRESLVDGDMYEALTIRRARRKARAARKRKTAGNAAAPPPEEPFGPEERDDPALNHPLLSAFDVANGSKARKDAFAQAFLDTFRPEMDAIRKSELEKISSSKAAASAKSGEGGGEKSKKKEDKKRVLKQKAAEQEAKRKEIMAARRMKNLGEAIRVFGFRNDVDKLIKEEIVAAEERLL